MAKIILFFPKLESKALLLPASLLYVAAPLVEKGYEVKIIDQRLEKDWQNLLIKELKDRPLAVGISAKTGKQIFYGLEASRVVKENSKVPVIWGGVHPTLLPEQTLQNPYIDFVVIGEGERTFLNLIQKLEAGDNYEDLDGIGFKKNNQTVCNPPKEFLNLDDLPEIPYQLVDIEKYIAKKSFASGKEARNIAFYTSRGCPHRCAFCYNKEFNKQRWRGESAPRVVERIKEMIAKYGITSLEIEDDEFFANPERAKEIAQSLIDQRIEIEIFTTCRVNYIAKLMDADYLKTLKRAGFQTLALGVESGSERIQKMIDKDIDNEQVLTTIKKLKEAGIDSKYYFMVGFPMETVDDIYATTDLIKRMKGEDHEIRIPAWRVFTPYPGTELYKVSSQYGFKPPQGLREWADYDFSTIKTPWIDAREKKIIENVAFLSKFINLQDKRISGLYGVLIKFYGRIADYRWTKHLFYFVPEKSLIELISKIKSGIAKQTYD